MTAAKDPPHEPYATEEGEPPPPEALTLWNEVGVLIDKSAQGQYQDRNRASCARESFGRMRGHPLCCGSSEIRALG
jgi:hypothetical protein